MTFQPVTPPKLLLQNERPHDAPLIEGLLARAFGPGRLAKASERVREFAEFRPDLSFCAWDGERLAGAVRQWRVRVGDRPAIFLGPLAVEEVGRKAGTGAALVERACVAAGQAGFGAVVLVGDESYFARMGFAAGPAALVTLPGPVDQRRVLARILAETPDGPLAGEVRA